MGHARVTNICKVVNRLLKEGSSIKAMVDDLELFEQVVHAGECDYAERYMLAMACEQIVGLHYKERLITPHPHNEEQRKVLKEWDTDAMCNWDNGDDGEGGEYGILDSILWHTYRKRLPFHKYISN